MVTEKPKRIISLVPSITELLFAMTSPERVVGRTKFCVHPSDKLIDTAIIGGTKTVDLSKLRTLEPDLVIASQEENLETHISAIEEHCPVWVSDVKDIGSSFDMISSLGSILGEPQKAVETINKLREMLVYARQEDDVRAAYLIWNKPVMTVGGDTFIHSMMEHLGFENVFEDLQRYPGITLEDIRQQKPDIVLLSSEPFPFNKDHLDQYRKSLHGIAVMRVDGELFSWYGSRLLQKKEYIDWLLK